MEGQIDLSSLDGYHFHDLTPVAAKRVIEFVLGDRKRAKKANRALRKLAKANKIFK